MENKKKITKKTGKSKTKKKKKSGFTLIELLAVIVILGILMIIAIPSVTKYINDSKKKTYIVSITNALDAVKTGVISEDDQYRLSDDVGVFPLSEIKLEKGKIESPYGNLIDEYSFIVVTKAGDEYNFSIQTLDDAGYYLPLTNKDNINNNIELGKKESETSETSIGLLKNTGTEVKDSLTKNYQTGDIVNFENSTWRVIDSKGSYATVMKTNVLTATEISNNGFITSNNFIKFTNSTTASYENSIAKTVVDNYANTLGASKLVSIDGYKARLIKLEELQNKLGVATTVTASWYNFDSNNTPSWVAAPSGVSCYWTMSKFTSSSSNMAAVGSNTVIMNNGKNSSCSIRPVINVSKMYLS